jgi:hypothetical protein
MSKNKQRNPRRVIHDFFSENSPEHYRKYISSMLKAAYSEGYWKKSDPGSLLHFQLLMEELIEAMHVFVKQGKKHTKIDKKALPEGAVILEEMDSSTLVAQFGNEDIWALFPRSLSKKEFQNPYLVCIKFFRTRSLEAWLKDFGELISYALSPFGNESALDFDYLEIHQLLQKLVEAAYLIEVRTHKPETED